jgi:hypothetical protein
VVRPKPTPAATAAGTVFDTFLRPADDKRFDELVSDIAQAESDQQEPR